MIDTTAITPHGRRATYATRLDTNDAALLAGIIGEDEYGLAGLPELTGWAVDIGAHIGTVAIALATDHPMLQVVAIEALPENAAVLATSVERNHLAGRVHVVNAAAGAEGETEVGITYGWERADNQPDHYMHDNRYIGGMLGPNETTTTLACPAISLGAIMARFEIERIALLKIDCEGCEWFVLTSPAVAFVDLIIGEMHVGRHGGAARLRELLEPTHIVEMDDSLVVAHFRAVRR